MKTSVIYVEENNVTPYFEINVYGSNNKIIKNHIIADGGSVTIESIESDLADSESALYKLLEDLIKEA